MSMACCVEGCGGVFCFAPEIEVRLRRTHESFTCPFGHSQSFAGKTEQEKKIAHLKEMRDMWRDNYVELNDVFVTCPYGCGWKSSAGTDNRWMSMLRHFDRAHQAMAEGTPMSALFFEVRNG